MGKTKKIWEKAKKTASDPEEVQSTLTKAGEKLKGLAGGSKELDDLKSKLQMLIRMVQAYISGEYRSFPTSTILIIVFALLYFVIPTDLIPDFIPALGFTDDASIVLFVIRRLNKDIQEFQLWEEAAFKEEE